MQKKAEKVFEFFREIAKIPHGSFNETAIGDYLLKFAEDRNLEASRDAGGNVYIKKAATRDREEPIILQGHMDMVCVKEDGVEFDFEKDALNLYEEDGFLKARGTTLGADNGIAVAMILAILDDDSIMHTGIEAIITTREEVGLLGAAAVEGDRVSAKTLINIDSEEENIFTVSCCGGVRQMIELPITKKANPYDKTFKIVVSGLKGGHSGMEIGNQRANAIKLMGRVLNGLNDYALVKVDGGEAMNAIAKYVEAEVATNEDITSVIADFDAMFKKEYQVTDAGTTVSVEAIENAKEVLNEGCTLANVIMALPHGVQKYNDSIDGLVQTSTNVGVIKTEDDQIIITDSHRSSIESEKHALVHSLEAIAALAGGTSKTHGDYVGWEYAENSRIRDHFIDVHKKQYGKEPEIMAIHAGLECGILQQQIGTLDMISIGPEMFDVHTPKERLNIASTERTYELLLTALATF